MKKNNAVISHRAGLTESQVREVYRLIKKEGKSQNWVARKFHVSQSAIYNLIHGKTYRNVSREVAS